MNAGGGWNDEEMREMLKEENDAKARIEELEAHPEDPAAAQGPPTMTRTLSWRSVRAQAGDEAALFAAEIYRMYVHYAESRRWKVEMMEGDEIGIGGMKSVTFMINGQGAYSVMKYESPAYTGYSVCETESGGRIIRPPSVAVMPEAEEVDVQIDEKRPYPYRRHACVRQRRSRVSTPPTPRCV